MKEFIVEKVIVLAAGESSRFWPLALNTHKSFYRCGLGTSLIEQTVTNLLENIEELRQVVIVVSPRDLEQATALFTENDKVKIVVQNKSLGEGDAILCAREHLETDERFFLTTGDKVNAFELLRTLLKVGNESIGVRSGGVNETYGLVRLNINRRVVSISEKPSKTEDFKQRITSAYVLSRRFFSYLENSKKDHYSLEISLSKYIKDFDVIGVVVDAVPEVTLKYPWHLLSINKVILSNLKSTFIDPTAVIAKTAQITGPVFIDSNAKIMDFAKITGPVYIGKNAVIGDYSSVRDNSFLDDDVLIGSHSEIKNSIIYKDSHFHRNFVGDSIIDTGARIGAGAIFANKRIDRGEVTSQVKEAKIGTGLKALGAILGKNAKVGVNSSLMPGVKLGQNAQVFPQISVFKDVKNGGVAKLRI